LRKKPASPHLASQPGFRKASLKAGNVNQASSQASRPP